MLFSSYLKPCIAIFEKPVKPLIGVKSEITSFTSCHYGDNVVPDVYDKEGLVVMVVLALNLIERMSHIFM